jgi:hypothetical protein
MSLQVRAVNRLHGGCSLRWRSDGVGPYSESALALRTSHSLVVRVLHLPITMQFRGEYWAFLPTKRLHCDQLFDWPKEVRVVTCTRFLVRSARHEQVFACSGGRH